MSKIIFKISRFAPESHTKPYFDTFTVETVKGMSVLEGLFYILEKLDGSLAFRYSCRGAVCGSCAMFINGQRRLACQTLIAALKTKVVTVEPLPHFKVIKDLVVEMEPFFDKYKAIKPYLINDTAPLPRERIQSPEQRQKIDEMVKCILCGACYSACPMANDNDRFLGPAALTKAYRFHADSRDTAKKERLELVDGENGVFRCHTVFACGEACPKDISPTYPIQQLKGAITRSKF